MTDSRVSRGVVQALTQPVPDARVSRGVVQALTRVTPDARVSRGLIQVLRSSIVIVPDPVIAALSPSMWLEARSVAEYDGGALASWPTLSAGSTGAVQATAGSQPISRFNRTPNGGPAVDFSGSKYMTSSDSRSSTAQTIVAVVKRPADAVEHDLIGASNTGGLVFRVDPTTGLVTLRCQSTATFGTGATVFPTTWAIMTGRVTSGAGGSWKTRINRAADGSGSTTQAMTASLTTFLGTWSGLNNHWNGEIAEILTFPRALSDTEVGTVEDYLYNRWFVAAGPTIKYWDGSAKQTATLKGWWDGSAVQPVTAKGWWDGSTIQSLS